MQKSGRSLRAIGKLDGCRIWTKLPDTCTFNPSVIIIWPAKVHSLHTRTKTAFRKSLQMPKRPRSALGVAVDERCTARQRQCLSRHEGSGNTRQRQRVTSVFTPALLQLPRRRLTSSPRIRGEQPRMLRRALSKESTGDRENIAGHVSVPL